MGVIGLALGRIPVWVWLIVAALGWGAWQRHLATAAERKLRDRDAAVATATITALTQRLAEQERILKEQQHAAEQAQRARDAAEVARVAADGAVDQLRRAARAAAARVCPSTTTAAAVGATSPGGADVLADVLGRLAQAGGDRAAALDAARIAGIECERRYDSLRSAQP